MATRSPCGRTELFLLLLLVVTLPVLAQTSTYAARTGPERLGPELLRGISEATGGTSFVIEDPNDLVEVAKAVGMMLRNQYLLGYRPAATRRARERWEVAQNQDCVKRSKATR